MGVILAMVLLVSSTASATLLVTGTGEITNGGSGSYKLIYDNAQDITWLDYTSGSANWTDQSNWADNLVVTFEGLTLDEWRLPIAGEGTSKSNHNTPELGDLYYNSLGGTYYNPPSDTDPFENLIIGGPPNERYWTQTDSGLGTKWIFQMATGQNLSAFESESNIAIAVMDGQVPEPATLSLLALGGLALIRRRRTA